MALCFTFNLGEKGNGLFIKPSVYLMPEQVFTNQANLKLYRNKKGVKAFKNCINLYKGPNSCGLRKGFQINVPLPDIVTFLDKGRKKKSRMANPTRILARKQELFNGKSHNNFKSRAIPGCLAANNINIKSNSNININQKVKSP